MQSSKRAVEAYWRTRLIDHVTTDDDKVAPVYRLDEICDTIRSSPSDIVREMFEYTMKRLDNKSPRVKQKALRMIKYVVGKAGPDFRRQMQRQSATIRQLFDYKGPVDALRGDALNKAVRDTAHEAIAAIFASDDKLSTAEEVNKRIQGFGSTNFVMPAEGKKSLINDVVGEVVGFGSASIKQGLNLISGYSSGGNTGSKISNSGSYRGPSLRKSLTSERETFHRHEREESGDSRISLEVPGSRAGPSISESQLPQPEVSNGRAGADNGRGTSQEERLLDTITAPGGMRLQPTRESLQIFLANAQKLDPGNLGYVLESKLHSHSWQVRLKALCVLEAILRQKDQEFFGTVVELFEEDAGAIHECLQSPQTSLREKAKKVLDLLGVSRKESFDGKSEGSVGTDFKDAPPPVIEMPDLIDTREPDLLADIESLSELSTSTSGDGVSRTLNPSATAGDLLGDKSWAGTAETVSGIGADDPFAGLSFHTSDGAAGVMTGDLFSDLVVDEQRPSGDGGVNLLGKDENNLFDSLHFGKAETTSFNQLAAPSESLVDLMGSISLSNSGNSGPMLHGSGENGFGMPKSTLVQVPQQSNPVPAQMIGSVPNPQMMYLNPSLMLPTGMVGGFQPTMMLPQTFGAGALGNAFFQQQLIGGMAGLQRFGMGVNMGTNGNFPGNTGSGRGLGGSFPDGFDFSSDPSSRYTSAAENTKKEDTKAFDFISDHVGAARGPKKFS